MCRVSISEAAITENTGLNREVVTTEITYPQSRIAMAAATSPRWRRKVRKGIITRQKKKNFRITPLQHPLKGQRELTPL
jgi:hypothetical protein